MSRKKLVDKKDVQIINILQNNARLTNFDLAVEVDLSPGPTSVRVRNLFRNSMLKKVEARANLRFFGYNVQGILIAQVLQENAQKFVKELEGFRLVTSVKRLTSKTPSLGFDKYLICVECKDQEHLDRFVGRQWSENQIPIDWTIYQGHESVQDRGIELTLDDAISLG